jgi:diguanylate cyclase (GGDEF)-like protein
MGIFEKAQIDFLTGFFTRESFGHFLEKAMREATAANGIISLAMIDLDHFKQYNDKYGHDFGDDILKYAASTIRLTMDENQTYFFRYGGDEFLVVFVGKGPKEVHQLLKSCRHNLLHRPFLLRNKFLKITMSIGLASFPHDSQTVEELVARVDEAMYYSKKHGRNRITQWSTIQNIKASRIFIIAGALIVMALSVVAALRMSFVKENMAPVVDQLKKLRIINNPETSDKVILKNGTVFEGRIVVEDSKMIMLKLDSDKGEGTLRLDKSKISKIQYGGKS